jgi:hypothetical protein
MMEGIEVLHSSICGEYYNQITELLGKKRLTYIFEHVNYPKRVATEIVKNHVQLTRKQFSML